MNWEAAGAIGEINGTLANQPAVGVGAYAW